MKHYESATKCACGHCSAKPVGLPSVRQENIDFLGICCGISLKIIGLEMYHTCDVLYTKNMRVGNTPLQSPSPEIESYAIV